MFVSCLTLHKREKEKEGTQTPQEQATEQSRPLLLPPLAKRGKAPSEIAL